MISASARLILKQEHRGLNVSCGLCCDALNVAAVPLQKSSRRCITLPRRRSHSGPTCSNDDAAIIQSAYSNELAPAHRSALLTHMPQTDLVDTGS